MPRGDARVPREKTCYFMGPVRPFRSKHTNENSFKKLSLLNVTSSILPLRVHFLCSFTFFKVSTLRKVRRQHCLSLLVLGIFLHRLEFDKNWSFCRYVLDSRLSRLDSTTAWLHKYRWKMPGVTQQDVLTAFALCGGPSIVNEWTLSVTDGPQYTLHCKPFTFYGHLERVSQPYRAYDVLRVMLRSNERSEPLGCSFQYL